MVMFTRNVKNILKTITLTVRVNEALVESTKFCTFHYPTLLKFPVLLVGL